MTRKALSALAILCAAFALSACATTPTDQAGSSNKQSNIDHRYVAAVNRQARRVGTQVVWVNPPREKDRRKNDD